MVHIASEHALLDDLADDILHEWAEHGRPTPDPGPVVLASTMPPGNPAVSRAARAWLAGLRETTNAHPGLFGGLAGQLAGLRLLAAVHPPLERAADTVATALRRPGPDRGDEGFGFPDYDLVAGPAGVLLAHRVAAPRPDGVREIAAALAALCVGGVEGLRCTAYEGHEKLAWMQGRVNAGLAHGVPGVAVALAAALRAEVATDEVRHALHLLGQWLVAQAHRDPRGILTWPSAGGVRPPGRALPRQAWCYGCPGAAWSLWETGTALRRPSFTALAATAMRTLSDNYAEDFHLYGERPSDRLAVCHGAAGVLAVADAFTTHADLHETATLRRRLSGYLCARGDELIDLARTDMSVLTGAAGALAALRTAAGAPRDWLPVIGLR